jgi:hypothetical protein
VPKLEGDFLAPISPGSQPLIEYEVQFPDGHVEELTANVIAESMFSQVDDEGHHFQLMKEITDHKSDGRAITIENGYDTSRNGTRYQRRQRAVGSYSSSGKTVALIG